MSRREDERARPIEPGPLDAKPANKTSAPLESPEAGAPPVLATGGPIPPDVAAARAANGERFAPKRKVPPNLELTPRQRAERENVERQLRKNEERLKKKDSKLSLSETDRKFIDPSTPEGRRNLRRASDPTGQGLSKRSVDEARTMDLAERTGQLPGEVDRSGVGDADVRTTEKSGKETHFQMKAIEGRNEKELEKSMQKSETEIAGLAEKRAKGRSETEFLLDLKTRTDPKEIEAIERRMQAKLAAENKMIAESGSGKKPLEMRTILPEAILKARREAAAKAAAEKK